MKANEIQNILEQFLSKKSPYSCILINGTWGIGKTYEISGFFNTKKYKKIINVSLFGMKNLESLYSELSFQSFGVKSIGKNVEQIELPSLPFEINKIGSIATPKNIFNLLITIKKLEGYTIIFDDLERISREFPFEEFMGMVESLHLVGIRIILVANTKQFEEGNNAIFDKYGEKIIDKEYLIDKVSDSLMEKNERYNKDLVKEFITLHGINNIRTLIKAQNFFEDVYEKIKCISSDDIKEQIRKICYSTVFEAVDKIYEEKIRLEKQEEMKKGKEKRDVDFTFHFYEALSPRISFRYLKNFSFSNNIISAIIDYYETHRAFDIEILTLQYIEYQKQKEKSNYLKSTEEICALIKSDEEAITSYITLKELIVKANFVIIWKGIIDEDYTEILEIIKAKAKEVAEKTLNTSLSLDAYKIDKWDFHIESDIINELFDYINEYIEMCYFHLIFTDIDGLAKQQNYEEVNQKLKLIEEVCWGYIPQLKEHIHYLLNDSLLLKDNISIIQLECWNAVVSIVSKVDIEKLKEYIIPKLEEFKHDKMFVYRTKKSLREIKAFSLESIL